MSRPTSDSERRSLARQIEAGADMFLMPSAFEPCGLNQLYSLRYGTVPIVRATGGLADTIVEEVRSLVEATGGWPVAVYLSAAAAKASGRELASVPTSSASYSVPSGIVTVISSSVARLLGDTTWLLVTT